MSIRTFSGRDFSRHVGDAMRLALEGPVFITSRGKPAFVLLKIDDYEKLIRGREISLLELMDSMPRTDGADFEAQQIAIELKIPED
jgi:prevent-host-death family protein